MTDKNIHDTNNSCFYLCYAKQYYWTIEDAIALSLSLNPSKKIPESCNREYKARIELLKKAMKCDLELELDGSVKRPFYFGDSVTYPNIKPSSFIHWCKRKDFSFPEELERLVNNYSTSEYVDLKTLCKSLKEENERLKEDLKPLHGGERNGWIKLSAGFIGSNYDKLLSKDIRDWVEEVYKDFENVESSTDIELYDITLEKSTLTEKLTRVQKYCKEHSKPSTKK
jgi:hypothetical protein